MKKFKEVVKFLKETKIFLIAIIILFLASAILGYIYQPPKLVEMVLKIIEDLTLQTENYNFLEMFVFILQNNLKSSFFGIILGPLLGIMPVFSTALNGYVIGFVGKLSVENFGSISLLRLLPHGIFELPAVIISLSLGLRLFTQLLTAKKTKETFLYNLENSLWTFLYIVFPLLLIAAIIETILIFSI